MNKKLRFSSTLIPLIIRGEKTATWRLWDDKNLQVGDMVDFLETGTDKHFATTKLTEVSEKPMGQLTNKDKEGHEQFKSDKEMYQTYSNYYQKAVSPNTIVKIIHFQLLNGFPLSRE